MKARRRQNSDTSQRLLDAAVEVFAEMGYRDATIADICGRAEANIAAVNYHFGGKDTLYVEAWRLAFRRSLEAHPPDGGVPAGAPPDERLRGRLRGLLGRILDPASQEFAILGREMTNPTGLLGGAIQEAIDPLREVLHRIILELLGPAGTDNLARACAANVVGPCLHMMMRKRHLRSLSGNRPPPEPPRRTPEDIDALANHMTRFALAGLTEMRRLAEAGEVQYVRIVDERDAFEPVEEPK